MEKDKNPFPKIDITPVDVLKAIGGIAYGLFTFLPNEAPDYMSDHYRGGAALLDQELYDQDEAHMQEYWQGVLDLDE